MTLSHTTNLLSCRLLWLYLDIHSLKLRTIGRPGVEWRDLTLWYLLDFAI